MIDERDKLIADAAKRFGLLKDDFQYNLTLLEARDAEITRLSTVERELRNEVEEIEGEKLALSNRLNEILQKDMARAKKYKQDKEKTKVSLSPSVASHSRHTLLLMQYLAYALRAATGTRVTAMVYL